MPGHNKKRGYTGGALAIVAAILLIVALFLSWYQISNSASGTIGGTRLSVTSTVRLNAIYGVTTSCSGSSFCPPSKTQSFSDAGFNSTGRLYTAVEALVIVGFILGLVGAVLAFVFARGKDSMKKGAIALLAIAMILAVVAPIALVAAQPAAIKSDISGHGGSTNGTGPQSSFFGSCSGSSCTMAGGAPNATGNWGADAGWYVSVVAFVLFLVSLIVLARPQKPMPTAMPTPAPTASSAPEIMPGGQEQPAPMNPT